MDLPTRPDGPSPEDLLARADSLRDGKAWADAAELYADYLRCRPEHWQIWVQYGHCTKECGDAETALLLYREAERLRPEEADIHLHLGHALKLLGRADEAAEAYARALSLDPANEAARSELLAVAGAAQPASGAPGPAVAREAASACVFDASDLLDYAKRNRAPTGIQRVQLNLIERSLGLGGAVAAFDTASGAWKPVPRAAFERLAALSRSGADPDDPDWKDAVSALSDAVRRGPQLEFAPGGMLVTLGTAWWIPNYLLRVREAKARHGLRYVPMVYDCIPVVRPEDCAEGLCAEFAAWFAGACVHADAMLAISDCTRDDVLRLRRGLLPGAEDIPVAVLPLHAGPLLPEPAAAPASPRRRPYVLFVATVEARKNHLMVFNAWLSLIRRHGADAAPDLVCVGKRGWKADEAFALLAGSRALRERVFLLHDVSDAELDALYRGCLCTVFNSRYEGWGLPVTESIGYGKVPIVADNSSLRQAGGEAALFFASGSEPELVARLEAMLFDADFRAAQEAKVREAPPLRRWDELAADLAAALAAVPAVPTPPLARLAPFFRAGADYAVRALPGSDPTLEMAVADAVREGPCWGRLKEWGVRALRGCAVLRLPGAALHGTARITLQMQGPPGGGRFGLRAGPAGAVDGPFRWIEATDHERLFCVLEVPDAAGRELVVEIDTPEGSRLEDGRLVGPNLLGFMVCAADDFAARLGYLERKALAKLIAV